VIAELSARVERKYAFPGHGAQAILAWLEHSCLADPLYPGGTVSTIYFDTPELAAYREKRDGDFLKCKLRLRWYTAPGPADAEGTVSCYLEAKRREGAASRKSRLPLSLPSGFLGACPPRWAELGEIPMLHPELTGGASALVPMILVRYERRRFVDPASGARVSLDTDIRCDGANGAHLAAFAPVGLDAGVLEIKAPRREVPRSLVPIRGFLTPTSFSKYARCLRLSREPGRRGEEE
jgi:hypothetical protein